jgi:uncharacterized membrane protein YhaH (DUF805 family)
MAATFVAAFAVIFFAAAAGASERDLATIGGLMQVLLLPPMLLVGIGAGVRRWHDLGRSGWHVLLAFLPCANVFVLLYMLFAPGIPNSAGSPPDTPGEVGPTSRAR